MNTLRLTFNSLAVFFGTIVALDATDGEWWHAAGFLIHRDRGPRNRGTVLTQWAPTTAGAQLTTKEQSSGEQQQADHRGNR